MRIDFSYLKGEFKDLGLDWSDSKGNPLNALLPAYETLWRVVAHCLIEVAFRLSADLEWLRVLETFRKHPGTTTFSAIEPGQDNVSAKFLVDEALRLYPPTRRIYRHVHYSGQANPELLADDIEQCHRLTHIWGQDSYRYRPARWTSADKGMRDAFMPFGGKHWICPASSGFGPMMIGTLVATFAVIISNEEWELRLEEGPPHNSSQFLDDEMEIDSDRHGSRVWELVRRNQ